MKKHLSILAVVSLFLALPALAADGANALNELSGSANMALSFSSGADTAFTLGAQYSRFLADLSQSLPLQGTAIASLFTQSGNTTLSAAVGPTLNYAFDESGIANAAYLTAAGGIAYTKFASASSSNFAYHLEAGKRFGIVEHVTWKPAFVMSGTTATGSNPQYRIVPVQISVLF